MFDGGAACIWKSAPLAASDGAGSIAPAARRSGYRSASIRT